MAASSSSAASFFGARQDDRSQFLPPNSSEAPPPLPPHHQPPQPLEGPPQKKKRNQPRTPNSDAEVIALSPKTLMATNRFICEVCNKGFQREQNLQLHRRGHNLPWKLKQKSTKEVKRKVYLCPEPSCVHHDPSRALGDLTGIKKHYYRKHGEKKWKCEKCSKRYAVQSDWKAHSKTCGTKEYRCDCGTLFSRRDSFITHRAFCDALAQESARHPTSLTSLPSHHFPYGQNTNNSNNTSRMILGLSHMGASQNLDPQSGDVLRLGSSGGGGVGAASRSSSQLIASNAPGYFMQEQNPSFHDQQDHQQQGFLAANNNIKPSPMNFQQSLMQFSRDNHNSSNLFNLSFLSGHNGVASATSNPNAAASDNLMIPNNFDSENAVGGGGGGEGEGSTGLFPNNLMSSGDRISSGAVPSLFGSSMQNPNSTPHMSATALLQKAAQIGSSSSGSNNNNNSNNASSILRSFGSGMYGENESNLNDLMNSFSNPGATGNNVNRVDSPFGSYGGVSKGLNTDKQSMTRDFLGVGQIMRSMSGSGGLQQQHQQQHENSRERVGSSSDSADRNGMNVNHGGGPASSPPYGIPHASF
ncbi:Protein indeterminate-domain 5 [Hirschfeldia incana]|nr:Protein indeterminate-domain 5 [Hirschfeldia incana]